MEKLKKGRVCIAVLILLLLGALLWRLFALQGTVSSYERALAQLGTVISEEFYEPMTDEQLYTGAAQKHALLGSGYAQSVGSGLSAGLGDGDKTVPVGVGLDHTEKAALRRELFPQGVIIVIQIVQGYLCPGPL